MLAGFSGVPKTPGGSIQNTYAAGVPLVAGACMRPVKEPVRAVLHYWACNRHLAGYCHKSGLRDDLGVGLCSCPSTLKQEMQSCQQTAEEWDNRFGWAVLYNPDRIG